jgi:hypothetical protein
MRIDLYNLYLLQWTFRINYVHHTLSYMAYPDSNRGNVLNFHPHVPVISVSRYLLHTLVRMTFIACMYGIHTGVTTSTYTSTHDICCMY